MIHKDNDRINDVLTHFVSTNAAAISRDPTGAIHVTSSSSRPEERRGLNEKLRPQFTNAYSEDNEHDKNSHKDEAENTMIVNLSF